MTKRNVWGKGLSQLGKPGQGLKVGIRRQDLKQSGRVVPLLAGFAWLAQPASLCNPEPPAERQNRCPQWADTSHTSYYLGKCPQARLGGAIPELRFPLPRQLHFVSSWQRTNSSLYKICRIYVLTSRRLSIHSIDNRNVLIFFCIIQ